MFRSRPQASRTVRERHQEHAANPRLQVLLGKSGLPAGEALREVLKGTARSPPIGNSRNSVPRLSASRRVAAGLLRGSSARASRRSGRARHLAPRRRSAAVQAESMPRRKRRRRRRGSRSSRRSRRPSSSASLCLLELVEPGAPRAAPPARPEFWAPRARPALPGPTHVHAEAHGGASRNRRPTASGRLDVTTSSASSKPGTRARASLFVEHEQCPSKISSSCPPTQLQSATKHELSRARVADISLALPVVAPDVERRGGDVRQEPERLRSARSVSGDPAAEVLADRRADQRLAVLEEKEVAPGREVAELVEDAVVREEALAVDRLHLAAGADGAGVVEVAVEVGHADERDDPVRGSAISASESSAALHEAGPQQQILRRVARDGELGEEDEVGAGGPRLIEPRAGCSRFPSESPTVVSICARASLMAVLLAIGRKPSSPQADGVEVVPPGSPRPGRSTLRCRRARRAGTGTPARPLAQRRARARSRWRQLGGVRARRPRSRSPIRHQAPG